MPEESTTPDLEEALRRFVDAINAQDFDAAVSIYAHDAILDTSVGIHRGRAAIRGFIEDWLGTYEQHDWKADEVRDVGNGVVFVVVCQRARLPDTHKVRQVGHRGLLWHGAPSIPRFEARSGPDF